MSLEGAPDAPGMPATDVNDRSVTDESLIADDSAELLSDVDSAADDLNGVETDDEGDGDTAGTLSTDEDEPHDDRAHTADHAVVDGRESPHPPAAALTITTTPVRGNSSAAEQQLVQWRSSEQTRRYSTPVSAASSASRLSTHTLATSPGGGGLSPRIRLPSQAEVRDFIQSDVVNAHKSPSRSPSIPTLNASPSAHRGSFTIGASAVALPSPVLDESVHDAEEEIMRLQAEMKRIQRQSNLRAEHDTETIARLEHERDQARKTTSDLSTHVDKLKAEHAARVQALQSDAVADAALYKEQLRTNAETSRAEITRLELALAKAQKETAQLHATIEAQEIQLGQQQASAALQQQQASSPFHALTPNRSPGSAPSHRHTRSAMPMRASGGLRIPPSPEPSESMQRIAALESQLATLALAHAGLEEQLAHALHECEVHEQARRVAEATLQDERAAAAAAAAVSVSHQSMRKPFHSLLADTASPLTSGHNTPIANGTRAATPAPVEPSIEPRPISPLIRKSELLIDVANSDPAIAASSSSSPPAIMPAKPLSYLAVASSGTQSPCRTPPIAHVQRFAQGFSSPPLTSKSVDSASLPPSAQRRTKSQTGVVVTSPPRVPSATGTRSARSISNASPAHRKLSAGTPPMRPASASGTVAVLQSPASSVRPTLSTSPVLHLSIEPTVTSAVAPSSPTTTIAKSPSSHRSKRVLQPAATGAPTPASPRQQVPATHERVSAVTAEPRSQSSCDVTSRSPVVSLSTTPALSPRTTPSTPRKMSDELAPSLRQLHRIDSTSRRRQLARVEADEPPVQTPASTQPLGLTSLHWVRLWAHHAWLQLLHLWQMLLVFIVDLTESFPSSSSAATSERLAQSKRQAHGQKNLRKKQTNKLR